MVMPSLVTRSDTSNIGILSHTRNQIALIRYSVNWSCWLPWMSIQASQDNKFKPDDHSEVVPLLPIPNRTVKRLCANDSAGSRVKVGHRQANIVGILSPCWVFLSLKIVILFVRLQSLAIAKLGN